MTDSHARLAPLTLISYLKTHDMITAESVERFQDLETDEPPEFTLIKLGLVSEADMTEALCAITKWPALADVDIPGSHIEIVSINSQYLRARNLVPMVEMEDVIIVAACYIPDPYMIKDLEFCSRKTIAIHIGTYSVLQAPKTNEVEETKLSLNGDDAARLQDLASEAPTIHFVDQLIKDSIKRRASDIHIEPTRQNLQIRIRIDGALHPLPPVKHLSVAAIVSRIKVLANLDIAERRKPQDGRIRMTIDGHEIDMRISITPTMHGENVVMRLLDQDQLILDFETLGFNAAHREQIRHLLDQPHGLLLVSGPTGSGKTTTLYGALQYLNQPDRKILTVENPVEYMLEGISQTQTNPDIGITFANALRSFLRQDPDVMMVGEIRDKETAEVAVQAALTGHLLLSTVHTNNALGVITRLKDLGVEPFILSSTIKGVISQRLVGLLCDTCKEPYSPPQPLRDQFSIPAGATLYGPKGCPKCNNTGYRGRIAIAEILTVTDDFIPYIMDGKSAPENGMISLLEDGIEKVCEGHTSLDEVLRVARQ